MNRTTWLQDRRMKKFIDVLSRWERRELSALDASELLGCSERQFRRYRRRYEEEGLDGLLDKRLGHASAKRVPVDVVDWMVEEYRTHHAGLRLQLPPSPARAHFVKASVKVRHYPDGSLAVFHGPRRLARYDAGGQPIDVTTLRTAA